MGKVFKPEDLMKGRRKVVDEALRDLSPGVRETTKRILQSWKGAESEARLLRLLGEEEMKRILKKIKP